MGAPVLGQTTSLQSLPSHLHLFICVALTATDAPESTNSPGNGCCLVNRALNKRRMDRSGLKKNRRDRGQMLCLSYLFCTLRNWHGAWTRYLEKYGWRNELQGQQNSKSLCLHFPFSQMWHLPERHRFTISLLWIQLGSNFEHYRELRWFL